MQKKTFIILFLVIIYGLLLMYPINYILVRKGKVVITNFYTSTPNLTNGPFSKITNKLNTIKAKVVTKSVNYLFMYDKVNEVNKKVNASLNKGLYNLMGYDYYPVGINHDGEYIFRNNEQYILRNNLSNEELDKRLDSQIEFFNSLDYDIKLYIPYLHEYLSLDNSIDIRNMDNYRDKFLSNINDNYTIGEFRVSSDEDYNKYFYHTDHHYNMYGALESYKKIMTMLGKDYNEYAVDKHDLKIRGSLAKSSYLKDLYDNFYTSEFNLEGYTVLVDNKENSSYKPKDIKISSNPFYDEYVHYYNGLFGLRTYDFNKGNNENILILEDSYGWQIDDLIASNYDKSYIIDLRYYDFDDGKIKLSEFIQKNNIKDILFIYEAGSILFDQYDYGMKDKVTK